MIHRSPYPDIEIPNVSLAELILRRARGQAGRAALIDGLTGRQTTYADLAEAVERTASGLHLRGFRQRNVAVICTPNRPEFATAFLAVARLGGTVTTMNPAFTDAEMKKQLEDARPVIGFASSGLVRRLHAAGSSLRNVYDLDRLADLADPSAVPDAEINPAEDVVALPYSSGTTGAPKGVMLTHRNLVAQIMQLEPVSDPRPDEVSIVVLPFFHIYGLMVILLLGLHRGATLVIFPRFEMDSFLTAIERYRVTRLPLVPPLVLRLAHEPRLADFDLSSVRVVVSGAAPLAPELAAELSARLGGVPVTQGYGMTEISPGGHMHPQDGTQPPPGSVGLLHPNTELRIVDPAAGVDVGPGETGELWYRGPQVMKGYLGRPEETAATITPDGWLRTGDIGRVGDGGQLYVVDRLKEMIKYKGFQVAPAELEALLLTHPSVTDAAVVARPDPEAGEVPMAFVVRDPANDATRDALIEFVASQVAPFKRIRDLEFVDEIPKSPSGKTLRRILVDRERRRAATD